MRTNRLLILFWVACSLMVASCGKESIENRQRDMPSSPIVILYDNDVHCSVDGYPMLVSLRNECLSATDYVSTVSCGDFASGGIVGAITKGEQVVEIMN